LPGDKENLDYLKDLKKLKAKSRRDGSVLQSRTQAVSLVSLGMADGLGFFDSSHENLNSSKWRDNFQHSVNFFPVGTAADIDFIMQYTLSNASAVHSMYLTPTPGLSPAQSDNVERMLTYAWLSKLLDKIISDARSDLHVKLCNSPLQRKLLLCHKKVYALLHLVAIQGPDTTARIQPVPSAADERMMHKRIIGSLMKETVMYYVDTVDRHVEVKYDQHLFGQCESVRMKTHPTKLRALTTAVQ